MSIQISKSSWVSDLRWHEIEQKIETGAYALLPIGACAKEHGLHMPMNTDYIQAKWLADRLARQKNLLIWPIVNYGYYPAFVDYPGSVTLEQSTFTSMIDDILRSIFRAGVSTAVLLNTGISTIRPLNSIIQNHAGRAGLINIYSGKLFRKASREIIKQSAGGHADETETSILLAIDDSLVDMDEASGTMQACSQPGVLSRHDRNSINYSPTGACGAPQLATVEKGRILLTAILGDINDQLSKFC